MNNLRKSTQKIYGTAIVLVAIMGIGLVLRVYGIHHGLPYQYDPDEPTFIVLAGGILANLDLNPHWFGHPCTLLIYLLAALDVFIYISGLLTGRFQSPQDFRNYYHQDPTAVYLGGRILVALFGIATLYLVYKVASKMGGKYTGLLAAFFLAIAPLHVTYSKFVRTDAPATFFILLSFYFSPENSRKREAPPVSKPVSSPGWGLPPSTPPPSCSPPSS